MHLLSQWKNNIPAASQLSVCTCRILSFIEHVYCFFRSSKFQLGCRLPRLGFVFNRTSPWRQWGTKIQQVSTGLWPASVSYILSYNIRRQFFFTESNTQPSSIFLLKCMSYIRFLISTYSFTSSYTRIIILKTHKIPFSYLHPYFWCFFPPNADFFTTGFPLNQLNCPTSYLLTKTKRFFWQINKFLKMFIISGLQKFGLHRNMQNKVELFDRGPGQKMGCNKLLKN